MSMSTLVVSRDDIEHALGGADVLGAMESAFMAYSGKRAIVPPVGELLFDNPPGDAHIKYGYIKGDDFFVIKVATGFYDNPSKGLPANSGLMLVFDARTGLPSAVLLDEGHLTNVRTAAAGAVSAQHLAPPRIHRIGICGTGVQARLQLQQLAEVTECREALVWGRSSESTSAYCEAMSRLGFRVEAAKSTWEITRSCNLIVTATIASDPILAAADVQAGTHITAMGSDTPHKNELEPQLLATADLVVADSISQCMERGEIHHALHHSGFSVGQVVELGAVVAGDAEGRTSESQITICDLTGVAVQDIEICKAVLKNLPYTQLG
jgi:ornithine cyclodeaminase